MSSTPKVTGAVHVFCGVGPNKAMRYLGTGQTAPRWRINYGWIPFFNDIGGSVIPMDELYAGSEALVSIDLNRDDAATKAQVESIPNAGGLPGLNVYGDLGSMMIAEGLAYPLVLQFPYYTLKPALRAAGLPPGIVFPFSWVKGPSDHTGGTAVKKTNLIFQCRAGYNPSTGALLLAHNTLPPLPPVT